MKLKKKAKVVLGLILLAIIIIVCCIIFIKPSKKEPTEKEVKVLKSIDEYGYNLKENKDEAYKKLFKELEEILRNDQVSDEAYVKKLAEMFITDFYSLESKSSKADVGGVDFVHPSVKQNFLQNAENTYYKYVESNIYGERKQKLPVVSKVVIDSITATEYAYNDTKSTGYEVKASWEYKDPAFSSYQSSATLTFVKEEKIYYLVELR